MLSSKAEPYPKIVWYEPMDHVEANRVWRAACVEYLDARWGIDDNPFNTPSEVFRFLPEESEIAVHRGYTHKDGPRLIGILIEQQDDGVFESSLTSVYMCTRTIGKAQGADE